MEIIYDENKNSVNQTKHGLSLALATELEWDWLQVSLDIRKDYGELRMIGFAPIEDRVYCVVYVDRDQQRRIISLRKANKREVKSYENKVNT